MAVGRGGRACATARVRSSAASACRTARRLPFAASPVRSGAIGNASCCERARCSCCEAHHAPVEAPAVVCRAGAAWPCGMIGERINALNAAGPRAPRRHRTGVSFLHGIRNSYGRSSSLCGAIRSTVHTHCPHIHALGLGRRAAPPSWCVVVVRRRCALRRRTDALSHRASSRARADARRLPTRDACRPRRDDS